MFGEEGDEKFDGKHSDNECDHVSDEEYFDGEEIAQWTYLGDDCVGEEFSFELLTGLSAQLLKETWVQQLPKPTLNKTTK